MVFLTIVFKSFQHSYPTCLLLQDSHLFRSSLSGLIHVLFFYCGNHETDVGNRMGYRSLPFRRRGTTSPGSRWSRTTFHHFHLFRPLECFWYCCSEWKWWWHGWWCSTTTKEKERGRLQTALIWCLGHFLLWVDWLGRLCWVGGLAIARQCLP